MPENAPAILLIAYGCCSAVGLTALRRFEEKVRQRFPGFPVRWAYTSEHIRTRLACQVRAKSDSVTKALRRLILERFGPIAAQPLQIVPATENAQVEKLAGAVAGETGVAISVGAPLLTSEKDMHDCVRAVFSMIPAARKPGESVVFMGHGTRYSPAQERYDRISAMLAAEDRDVHLATMSGDVTIEDIMPLLTSRRVWLLPFLSSVGRHTTVDMAGSQMKSWKSQIEAVGHECVPIIAGAIENENFADMWLEHLEAAAARIGISPAIHLGKHNSSSL